MPSRYRRKAQEQMNLPFGTVHNNELFSNHWLENRLKLEPEWNELQQQAREILGGVIKVWKQEKGRVERYENEGSLEYAFIQPILSLLGWKIIYQTNLRGRKPDYALFLEDESKDAALAEGKSNQKFWSFPSVLADAKAWNRSLDQPVRIENQREYPPEQIEWYLNNSHLNYGILTNGKQWRLLPRELSTEQPRFQTYLECDLDRLLNECLTKGVIEWSPIFEDFLIFYLFFSPNGFRSIQDRIPLVERARRGSSEYRLGIGRDLRNRAFEAVRLSMEGFIRTPGNNLTLESDVSVCREQSFILLYRLLFIMYAEDRALLPYKVNTIYTKNRSLGRLRDELSWLLDGAGKDSFSPKKANIWQDLQSLFDLIDSGHKTYGVPPYDGGLFSRDTNNFLAEKKMSDRYLALVIDQIGRAEGENQPDLGLYRVDYRDLQIQHLGNIYEGLLELDPQIAKEKMVVIRPTARSRRFEEKTVTVRENIPNGYESIGVYYEPGDIYLSTDKGERLLSGSYYTPNHIVDYIVEETLGPVCQSISDTLRREIEEAEKAFASASTNRMEFENILQRLRHDYGNRVLKLKILDPAMGSGHFLLRTCQFLAEDIATHPYTGDPIEENSESAITFWKRRVVERCVYGVDKNILAVELAKLALWLETVSKEKPLSFLEHHLREGNTLIGAKITEIRNLPKVGSLFECSYTEDVSRRLPVFLKPLMKIGEYPSNTPKDIKAKGTLYKNFSKARYPFLKIADLWCAGCFDENGLNPDEYLEAIRSVDRPKRFNELIKNSSLKGLLDRAQENHASFFHWELEFPEVMLGKKGPLGFDAVIGNPPYDVLSDKESGQDLTFFRKFITSHKEYDPSCIGKNNLYKLFICRAFELLAEGGRMGFITPMAVLGDEQALGIRKMIIGNAALDSIEAFPQKDIPDKRVFPDAKLSTTVFILTKTHDKKRQDRPFLSRVHSSKFIDSSSPSLTLKTTEIPLYDSSNLSIVSCSQRDWDLAVRIIGSGRFDRLSKYCKQYQGEVNETTDKTSLSKEPEDGPLIMRGSNVCLYITREASQGERLYLRKDAFLQGRKPGSKVFAFKQARIGFQRSSPQNNYRRIIAAYIEPDNFCFDTVSFILKSHSRLPLMFLLGLLNSKLLDWYFRLGSTNSKVNEYQFNNLPCPVFTDLTIPEEERILEEGTSALKANRVDRAFEILRPLLSDPPFSIVVREMIEEAVEQIMLLEKQRGEISRRDRSKLDTTAHSFQGFIDRCFYTMAGLNDDEAEALEVRLSQML